MHYEFADEEADPAPPGTALLVTGPDRATRAPAFDLLVPPDDPEAVTIVSTAGGPEATGRAYRRAGGSLDPTRLAVIDCTDTDSPEPYVSTVPSAAALAAVNTRIADRLERFGLDRFRLGVVSLTGVLGYTDLDRTIRFVNTLRERVRADDGLLVCTFDPAIDEGAGQPVAHLFDRTLSVQS